MTLIQPGPEQGDLLIGGNSVNKLHQIIPVPLSLQSVFIDYFEHLTKLDSFSLSLSPCPSHWLTL